MAGCGQPSLIGSDRSSTKSQYVPRLLNSFLLQSNSSFSAPAPEVYLARPQGRVHSLEKNPSHRLYQKASKRLYWVIALAQLSLISSTVALVLLVINEQNTHRPNSSLIAWFTASSIITVALALTVGIMWDQRRKRGWVPRKPSLLGLGKQGDIYPQDAAIPPPIGRKRTFFHRLASKNSLSQVKVARNTPMSETNHTRPDQPPTPRTPPCSRYDPTTRCSVSPARTMNSESSLAGEGYELQYIRSALSSPSGELPPSPSGSFATPKRPNPVRLPPLRTDSHTLRHGYRSPACPENRGSQCYFGPAIVDLEDDDTGHMAPPPASPAGSDEAYSDALYRHSIKPVPPLLLHERSWLAISARDDVSPLSSSQFCSQFCPSNCNHSRRNYSPPSGLGPPHEIHSLYAQLSAAFDSPKHRHLRHRAHAYNEPLAPELTSRFSPGSSDGSISGSSNNGPASPASSSPTTTSDKPSVAASIDLLSPIVYGVDVARDVEMFSAPPSMISLETLPMPPQGSSSKVNLAEPQTMHTRTHTQMSRIPSLAPSPALPESRPQTALSSSLPLPSGSRFVDSAEHNVPAWERGGGFNETDDFFAGLANSPSSASLYSENHDSDVEDVWPRGRQPSLPFAHASVPDGLATNSYFPPVSVGAASFPSPSPPTPFGTPSIGAPLARQKAVTQLGQPFSAVTFPEAKNKRGGFSNIVRTLSVWNRKKGAGSRSASAENGRAGFF